MRRDPLPQSIQNAPDLHLGLELFWKAYMDLRNDRPNGVGSRIGWVAAHTYARSMDLSAEMEEDLHFHIVAMDDVWLEHYENKNK